MNTPDLEPIFHPRAIAIVGQPSEGRGSGSDFFGALRAHGYHQRHRLYPVNPKATEIEGLPCYPSLLACPDPVDHVISRIPARGVPELVEQCIQKGVRSLHLYTAGFAETGDPGMIEVERRMAARARSAGLRIIGPNCLGLYVPAEGISFEADFPRKSGGIFIVSQSGANTIDMVRSFGERGVYCRAGVSYGNAIDLDAAELLDYAAGDPGTTIVAGYLEGIGHGRRLMEALQRCAAVKPVVLLKGGLTAAGARAANSHTGSLAGSIEVFDALCRQAGALRARTLPDLVDLVVALSTSARDIRGPRVLLMGGGGGNSVLNADAIATEGLELPPFTAEMRRALLDYIPATGNGLSNPIDAGFLDGDAERTRRAVMELVSGFAGFDTLFVSLMLGSGGFGSPRTIHHLLSGSGLDNAALRDGIELLEYLADLQDRSGRPIAVFRSSREGEEAAWPLELTEAGQRLGIGLFDSARRTARAIAHLVAWQRQREGLPAIENAGAAEAEAAL